MLRARLDQAALGAAALTACVLGFERIDPSLGLTQDLRLTNLRALALLTLVVWVLTCCVNRRLPRPPGGVALAAAAWLGLMVASAALAPSYRTQALAFTRDIVFGALVGWAVYDLATTRTRQLVIVRAIALGGVGVALVGIGEAARLQPILTWVTGFRYVPSFSIGEIPRVSATLPHPNVAAMFMGLTLPLQFAWAVTARRTWVRVLAAVGVLLELAVVTLTLSRAGVLVAEMVLGLMLLVGWRWRNSPLIGWSLGGAVGLPALVGAVVLFQPLLLLHVTGEGVEGWYAADYVVPPTTTAQAGVTTQLAVRMVNTGDRTWYAGGANPFALSYHLLDANGSSVTYDGPRTPLPHDVNPGEIVDVTAELDPPTTPGSYVLEWDVVQESVTWFSWTGGQTAPTNLSVVGAASPSAGRVLSPTSPPDSVVPPAPDRLAQWRIALRMARNRPLLGVGPDNFRWVYGDFAGLAHWDTGNHANSLYFEWLADTGVLGLVLFVWFALRLLRVSFAGVLGGSAEPGADTWRIWRLALAASLAAWFVHGIVDYFFEPLPTNLAFWIIGGLALAASRRESTACA